MYTINVNFTIPMSLNGLLLAIVVTYAIYIIQRHYNVHISSYFYWIIMHLKYLQLLETSITYYWGHILQYSMLFGH